MLCSPSLYSNELNLKSTQGDKVSYDEEDNVVTIDYFSYNLGNLIGEVKTFDEIADSNNFHLMNNGLGETIDDNPIHINPDLNMLSKFNYLKFEILGTC